MLVHVASKLHHQVGVLIIGLAPEKEFRTTLNGNLKNIAHFKGKYMFSVKVKLL